MDHIRYQKWGSSLSKFFERSFYIWFINFRLPEKAMVEIKPSAVNRSTNSDILICNRVDQLKIQFQQVHCRYQNVAQVQWKGCWETSVDRTTSRFTFHQTSGGISSAFDLFPTKKTFYSQVLSPTEEEVLVKQVTKMGENGPVIFDRHFFTLVRKYNTLPKSDCWLIHPGDWQTPWAQLWMDQLCQGACVSFGDINRNNPLNLPYISGVNVPLPEETCKMGFKEESASRGLIQKQDKVFDYLSFYRAGLTKVLMLVSFEETKSVRFQKLVLDPFWFCFSFGSFFSGWFRLSGSSA